MPMNATGSYLFSKRPPMSRKPNLKETLYWERYYIPFVCHCSPIIKPFVYQIIHINKPLCHLALMGRCGTGSWIPWLAALGMDVASLKLIDPTRMNLDEKQELKRRQLTLLMYLLRSPFYDRLSRRVLVYALTNFSRLPLIGILVQHCKNFYVLLRKGMIPY